MIEVPRIIAQIEFVRRNGVDFAAQNLGADLKAAQTRGASAPVVPLCND